MEQLSELASCLQHNKESSFSDPSLTRDTSSEAAAHCIQIMGVSDETRPLIRRDTYRIGLSERHISALLRRAQRYSSIACGSSQ